MKVVRVHNPNGLGSRKTKRKVKTMAKRRTVRRAATGRRRATRTAANPRRRRHSRRRNPGIVRRRRRSVARATNPRRHRRRRNPSAANIGAIFKNMVYGAGGAILTRVGYGLASGFIPGNLSASPFAEPVGQALIATTAVRWIGAKFLGKPQGDTMMLGGLISAGLSAADRFLPNVQGQLTSIIRAPVAVAPQAAIPVIGEGQPAAALNGMSDVYDVPGFAGFADVEDIDVGMFNTY
jgi:hypothetical protein